MVEAAVLRATASCAPTLRDPGRRADRPAGHLHLGVRHVARDAARASRQERDIQGENQQHEARYEQHRFERSRRFFRRQRLGRHTSLPCIVRASAANTFLRLRASTAANVAH